MNKGNSAPILINAVALVTFISGALISLRHWETGLPIMFASAGIICISRYRSISTGFAGSLALVPAVITFAYVYGAWNRSAPVYYTNVSATAWTIIIIGTLTLIATMWIFGLFSQDSVRINRVSLKGQGFFLLSGAVALALSAVNYATGDIPLLSGDINAARLNGTDYGLFGRLWPLIHPVTQVSVIIGLLLVFQRKLDLKWAVLTFFSAISLVLTGGRSLVGTAAVAVGVIVLELFRPKIQTVVMAMFAGLLALGAAGQMRAMSSAGASEAQSYLARRNLDSWSGSADLSLQTGPRVLSLAIEALHGERLEGRFLIGDLGNFVTSSIERSDRIITELIGRDPNTIGGSPPTIFGGFYLDFGWLGVVAGAILTGLLLVAFRRSMYKNPSLSSVVWYSYIASYVIFASYVHITLRPSWIVVLCMCAAAQFFDRGNDDPDHDDFEIQKDSRRRRASPKRSHSGSTSSRP